MPRAFETLAFIELAQALSNTGAMNVQCNVKDLLPSAVTVSRYTNRKRDSLRAAFHQLSRKPSPMFLHVAYLQTWTDDYRMVSYI